MEKNTLENHFYFVPLNKKWNQKNAINVRK